MAKFEIRVKKNSGSRRLILHAANEENARKLAARKGAITSIEKRFSFDFLPAMTGNERIIFLRRMSTMLASRVPVSQALDTMATSFGGEIRKAAQKMRKRLDEGFSLIECIEQDPRNFPSTSAALINAGLASGNTGEALRQAAEFETEINEAKTASMWKIYQAIAGFYAAGFIMLLSTYWVSPMVLDNPLFKQSGRFDFHWTIVLGNSVLGVLAAIIFILSLMLFMASIGRRLAPIPADRIIKKIPIYSQLVLTPSLRSSIHRLSLLVQQGIQIESALKLVTADTPPGLLHENLTAALDAVRKGRPWAAPMTLLHPTERAALSTSVDKKDVGRSLASVADTAAKIHIRTVNFSGPALNVIAAIFIASAAACCFIQAMIPAMTLMSSIAAQ